MDTTTFGGAMNDTTTKLRVGWVRRGLNGGWLAEAGDGWVDVSGDGTGWSARGADHEAAATRRQARIWVETRFDSYAPGAAFSWERLNDDTWECWASIPAAAAGRAALTEQETQ